MRNIKGHCRAWTGKFHVGGFHIPDGLTGFGSKHFPQHRQR